MESFVKVLFQPSAEKSIGITKTTMSTAMSTAISTDNSVDITHSKQDPKRLYNPHWERKLLAQQNNLCNVIFAIKNLDLFIQWHALITAVASMRRTEALASVKFYQILSIFIFLSDW